MEVRFDGRGQTANRKMDKEPRVSMLEDGISEKAGLMRGSSRLEFCLLSAQISIESS
jgi:hypothetical protein